jgi:SAM-dependent methyltransferase
VAEPQLLADLHAPLIPLLRYALATTDLPRTGRALDLACGPAHKLPLLAEACGPAVRLFGLDLDHQALRQASAELPWPTVPPPTFVVGDALALPLRAGCCDAVFCFAALGLFADQARALGELRRVLRHGGTAVVVTATQLWAQIAPWPADLLTALAAAWRPESASSELTSDLGAELAADLRRAGFSAPQVRAFALYAGHEPCQAELAPLPWAALRSLVAPRLDDATLARCDDVAQCADVELCSLALVAVAR